MRQLSEGNIIATLIVCCENGKLTEEATKSLNRIEEDYFFYDENKQIISGIKKLAADGELIDTMSISSTASKLGDKTYSDINAYLAGHLVDCECTPCFLDTYINRLIYEIKAQEVKELCQNMIVACEEGIASNNDIIDFNSALKKHIKQVKQY